MTSINSGNNRDLEKAALRGEPSYVWRAGQERRFRMILQAAGERIKGKVLENGCGVGMYVEHLAPFAGEVTGLEYDRQRADQAQLSTELLPNSHIVCAAGEGLPFADQTFDVILSHEVLEHVQDDLMAVDEMVRALKPGGRLVLFVPNRWYPFETHGIYWRGRYHFGNIPMVNYLPRSLRDRLAPHVEVYTKKDLGRLFDGLGVRFVTQTVLFGAYDNVIVRWPRLGNTLRGTLQWMEKTPLRILGLSHFWVVEKELPQSVTGSRKS